MCFMITIIVTYEETVWYIVCFFVSKRRDKHGMMHRHRHHLSFNREGRWGTTDNFATSFLHFSLLSTAHWDLANSRPNSLFLSSHIFLCLPCLLLPFTVPWKMVLARPDERETWLYHYSSHIHRNRCWIKAGVWWIIADQHEGHLQWIVTEKSPFYYIVLSSLSKWIK